MKYLLSLILFLAIAAEVPAQTTTSTTQATQSKGLGKIDTLTIGGLRPGDLIAAFQRLRYKIDTVFWTGNDGANMLKATVSLFGFKGESRMTTRDGEIQQLAFTIPFTDGKKAMEAYGEIDSIITTRFGQAKEAYSNVHHSIKWYGDKRVLNLKTIDNSPSVTLTLTQLAAPAVTEPKRPSRKK